MKRYVQNRAIGDDNDPANQRFATQSSDVAKVQILLPYLICVQCPISNQNVYGLLPQYKHKRRLPISVSNGSADYDTVFDFIEQLLQGLEAAFAILNACTMDKNYQK